METNFIRTLTERTKLSADEVKAKWLDGKDHWLNADEMVQFGLAKKKVAATAKNINDLNKEIVANMTVESVYGRFAACLDNTNINVNSKTKMDLILLITALSLEGVTAESGDAAVLAAIQAKFKALSDKVDALTNDANAKLKTQIKAMLDTAQADGKFVVQAGQTIDTIRATYQAIGESSGPEALSIVLSGMKAKTSIADALAHGGGNGGAATGDPKTFDELIALGDTVVAEWRNNKTEDYKRLYKAEFGHFPTI